MIIKLLGWVFTNEEEADKYMSEIDSQFGFPNEETLHYTFYNEGTYEDKPIYYLLDDPKLSSILGNSYIFSITSNM